MRTNSELHHACANCNSRALKNQARARTEDEIADVDPIGGNVIDSIARGDDVAARRVVQTSVERDDRDAAAPRHLGDAGQQRRRVRLSRGVIVLR